MIDLVQLAFQLRIPLLVGYAGLAILAVLLRSGNPPQLSFHWFVVLSLMVLLVLRFPSFFLNAPLNPDEAQFLASAIKFRGNMNSWLSVDTTTSGPINIYPLMWPFLFGADTGFAVARITATLLISATWFFFWTALASTPTHVRVWASACLILFMGGVQNPEFIHYSSEIVPSFLLFSAMVVTMVAVDRQPSLTQICVAGFCLGLVPFAKLQAAIIAATLGIILLSLIVRHATEPYRSVSLLISCACLPAVILLLPLAMGGGLHDFWVSYILHAKYYIVGSEDWGRLQSSRIWPAQLRALYWILRENFYGNLVGSYVAICVGAASLAIVALPIRKMVHNAPARRMFLKHPDALRTVIAFVVLVVSVCAVIASSRRFPHYAVLLIWPLTLLAGLAWSLASSWPAPGEVGHWHLARIVGVLSILCIGGVALREAKVGHNPGVGEFCINPTLYEPKVDYDPEITGAESVFGASQLLVSPVTGRGRMLIWGWMPQWYVWSGWMPATRDIITFYQIVPSPARGYFRDRMMTELRISPPDYIIDAVAPGSFGFIDPENEGLESFPELAAFVANDYVLLSSAFSGVSRPRVFARKDIAAFIEGRYAIPSRVYALSALEASAVSASASHVADGLVFESCYDSWLLPDGKLGEITMELADAQAIDAIEILNTRGGWRGNRAGKTARVLAYEGEHLVFDQEVQLLRFPYWTQIAVPDTIKSIDRVVVRMESYVGVGGGLNEIRLRKR
jgi:hypothetical protein